MKRRAVSRSREGDPITPAPGRRGASSGAEGDRRVRCPLCGRLCPAGVLERHHLKTRKRDREVVETICRECHDTIHGLFADWELRNAGLSLDSVDGLLANERFRRAVAFIRKVPPGTGLRMRLSRHAQGRRR